MEELKKALMMIGIPGAIFVIIIGNYWHDVCVEAGFSAYTTNLILIITYSFGIFLGLSTIIGLIGLLRK